jgi:hypothetical protein
MTNPQLDRSPAVGAYGSGSRPALYMIGQHTELKRGNKEKGKNLCQEARESFARLGAQMEVERMKDLPG